MGMIQVLVVMLACENVGLYHICDANAKLFSFENNI